LVVAWRILPHKPGDRSAGIDLVGAALIVASCALLVRPLNMEQEQGWPVWTWVSIGAGLAGFVFFARQERRAAAAGKTPLVVPRSSDNPRAPWVWSVWLCSSAP
jgi:hypothetical protein